MNTRLSAEQKWQIMSLWFEGETRDKTAKSVGVSAGSVSAVLAELRAIVGEDAFLFMRAFAVSARKSGTTVQKCMSGHRTNMLLERIGIQDPEQLDSSLWELIKGTEGQIDSHQIGGLLISLAKIQQKTKVPIEQIPDRLEEQASQLERINNQLPLTRKEVENLDAALNARKNTIERLDRFEHVEKELAKWGHKIDDDPQKLIHMLNSAKELGYSAEKLTEGLDQEESLLTRIARQKQTEQFDPLKQRSRELSSEAVKSKDFPFKLFKAEQIIPYVRWLQGEQVPIEVVLRGVYWALAAATEDLLKGDPLSKMAIEFEVEFHRRFSKALFVADVKYGNF